MRNHNRLQSLKYGRPYGNAKVLIRSGISPTGMTRISFIAGTSMAVTAFTPQLET
jgi:hypothetical protein